MSNKTEPAIENPELRILHLTLKKKWFDMILSGEKKEEYREIKPYWIKRLERKAYHVIDFRNGYSPNSPWMRVQVSRIYKGIGVADWGAPKERVFRIELGSVIETRNIAERVKEPRK